MHLTYENPGFSHSLDSILLFETDDQSPWWREALFHFYPIPGNHLVYGPVEIPETDSIICGFLAADGPDLEDLWYGIWYEMDGLIEKYVLFP